MDEELELEGWMHVLKDYEMTQRSNERSRVQLEGCAYNHAVLLMIARDLFASISDAIL